MSDFACVICAKRAHEDGATICRGCENRIDDNLAAIVVLTKAAAGHIRPSASGTVGGSTSPGSRPPLSVDALDDALGYDALPALASWERMWRENVGMSAHRHHNGDPASLAACCGFLRAQLPRMTEDPTWLIEEFARVVSEIAGYLQRYDDERQHKAGVLVPCQADHPDADGRTCGRMVRTNGEDVVRCQSCGTDWTGSALLDANEFELMTSEQLVLLVEVEHRPSERKRIANWAARNPPRITAHDYEEPKGGGKPIPLYRLGEYRALSMARLDKLG